MSLFIHGKPKNCTFQLYVYYISSIHVFLYGINPCKVHPKPRDKDDSNSWNFKSHNRWTWYNLVDSLHACVGANWELCEASISHAVKYIQMSITQIHDLRTHGTSFQ